MGVGVGTGVGGEEGVSVGVGTSGVLVGMGVSVPVGAGVKVGLGVLVGINTGVGALAVNNEVSGQPKHPNALPKTNIIMRITNRDLFFIVVFYQFFCQLAVMTDSSAVTSTGTASDNSALTVSLSSVSTTCSVHIHGRG